MSLRVVEHDHPDWRAAWKAWPEREPFGHPAYAPRFAGDDRVLCALLDAPEGRVLFPFVQRSLGALPWVPEALRAHCDLVGPYGYGGPFCFAVTDLDALAQRFWSELDAWAADVGAVSLFGRLSLFGAQRLPWPDGTRHHSDNVVVPLEQTPEELWRSYRHKVRKNVNKAERSGLRCTVDEAGAHLDAFLDIYAETMDRNQAASGYYFSRSFFEALLRDLPDGSALFHVWDGDRIVSTELVLCSRTHVYSFLGGTRSEAFAKRPNDLLKHEVCLWGSRTGRTAFVLGGGYAPDDGIYRYKLSFAPMGAVGFSVGQRTLLPQASADLVAARREADPAWAPREGWFPPYR